MSALGPGDISLRRRPLVIAGVAAARIFMAFLLAWPLASLISESGVGLRVEGDRALFEGGGYLLLELLRLQGSALAGAVRGLLPVFGLGLALTAVGNAVLLVALNTSGRLRRSDWLTRVLARVPGIIVLGAATALAQLLLIVAGVLLGAAVPERLASPVTTTLQQGAVWAVVLALGGAVGGFADVARAALVRYDSGLGEGLGRGLACLRHRPLRACFGWLPYAALLLLAILLGARLTELFDVSRAGAWRVAAVFAVHQALVLSAVVARAAWFAKALRLVATEAGV